METLRLLVQNLIIIIVLAVLLEMILPDSEMRRYTRMVLGLMIIVAVIQAMSSLSGGGLFREIEEYAWRSPPDRGRQVDILDQGRRLDEENRKQALDQYKKGVERQISALLGAEGKMSLVGADLKVQDNPSGKDFGRIQEISLVLGGEGGVRAVDQISVAVGGKGPEGGTAGEAPPEYAEAASRAARIVADFYNLPREQVRVRFDR